MLREHVQTGGPNPLTEQAREALEKMKRGEFVPPDAIPVHLQPRL